MTELDTAGALYAGGQYQQALALAAAQIPALLNIAGAAAYALGNKPEAEKYWRATIQVQTENPDAHNNLGLLYAESGRLDEAEAAFRRALAIHPGHVVAYNNLGLLLARLKRPAEAETAYRQALALQPDYADAYHNLGELLANFGCVEEAEAIYRQLLALWPADPRAYNSLGVLCAAANRHAEAEAAYRQALALRPDFAEAYNNWGILLMAGQRLEEAEAAFHRSIERLPTCHETHNNLGVLLKALKRYDESEAAYRLALRLWPDYADARFNLSLLLLSLGRFSEAWPLYEARYHPNNKNRAALQLLNFPQWQGEPLAGKSLLVWHEQGLGDAIQFCRFIPALKAQGAARIGLACQAPLAALFATLPGLDATHPPEPEPGLSDYDYWTFPLSIPRHYGLALDNIPATLPYLHVRPERMEKWQARLPPAAPRVGLVWKCHPGRNTSAERSLPGLAALAPLWAVSGIQFVSLQKGVAEDEAREPPPGQALTHLGTDIGDFADTAAIVAQLDLVICVDTAIAHLAGALAKPCWVLLPWHADWRWLDEREDSPWYPQIMRLFRQGRPGAWEEVVGRVAVALRQWRGEV